MVYRFVIRRLWWAVRRLLRRQLRGVRVPRPLLYAGGLAIVAAVAAVVLSRKWTPDASELAG